VIQKLPRSSLGQKALSICDRLQIPRFARDDNLTIKILRRAMGFSREDGRSDPWLLSTLENATGWRVRSMRIPKIPGIQSASFSRLYMSPGARANRDCATGQSCVRGWSSKENAALGASFFSIAETGVNPVSTFVSTLFCDFYAGLRVLPLDAQCAFAAALVEGDGEVFNR
jgi:hypothetical protein